MGRDKALLPFRGGALAEFVARTVADAAGSAVLVGDPALYQKLPYSVVADRYPGQGPLGGILTALGTTSADWNLVVACDMPGLSTGFLTYLLDEAEQADADAMLPVGPSARPEPLCAVYHRRALGGLEAAFGAGQRKITAALAGIHAQRLPVGEVAVFQNVNTPEEWADYDAK